MTLRAPLLVFLRCVFTQTCLQVVSRGIVYVLVFEGVTLTVVSRVLL